MRKGDTLCPRTTTGLGRLRGLRGVGFLVIRLGIWLLIVRGLGIGLLVVALLTLSSLRLLFFALRTAHLNFRPGAPATLYGPSETRK